MPVNNDFEKKVQQKMDELQLRPSPEVWTEVEKHIRKDKRRRVIFFWLPLAALLLGGIATVWIISSDRDNTTIAGRQAVSVSEKTNENNNTIKPSENTQDQKTQQQQTQEQDQQQPLSTPTDNNTSPSNTTNAVPGNNVQVKQKQNAPASSGNPVTTNTNNTRSSNNNNQSSRPRLQQDADAIISVQQANATQRKRKTETDKQTIKPGDNDLPPSVTVITDEKKQNVAEETKPIADLPKKEDVAINKKEETTNTIPEQQPSKQDSSNNIVTTDKKEETPVVTPETVAKKPKADKISRRKWQFGIEIQAGGSDTEEGGLFGMEKSLVYANPIQNGTAGPGSFLAGPFAPPILVTSPDAGMSAGIKLHAERPLSRRLSFQGSIGYTYLSTRIEVGSLINAPRQIMNDISRNVVVESFYGSSSAYGSATAYKNKFHLLGVSAGLSWKFIDKKKLTISWDNSISVNRLLSTNALLFDRQIRGYYKDFSAYQKTQVMFTTGFTVPVWRKNRFSLALHPFAGYALTPVLKGQHSESSHFFHYGMGLKFSFLPKK